MNPSIGNTAREMVAVSKSEALRAIPDRLEEKENHNDMEACLAQFRCQYDVVGSLPLELVLQIVKYLNPEDIVRSRRVSKQWLSIFWCDTIIKFFLRQTLAFLNIDGMDDDAADAMTYFRWQYSLQCGRPVKKIFVPFRDDEKGPTSVWYHSRRLFYCTDPWYGIQMLDLETGKKLDWFLEEDMDLVGEGRILVSDICIVLHDDSYLTARNLRTKQQSAGGNLPCVPHHIDLEKDKLVLVELLDRKESLWFIYVWDLNVNRIQRIGKFTNLWLWHLDVDENMLVVFEINWDAHPPQVQQTKWTLTNGQELDRKQSHLSLSEHHVDKNRLRPVDSFSNCIYGRKKIRRLLTGTGSHDAIDLIYDHAIDKLTVRWTSLPPQIYDLEVPLCAFLTPNIVYHRNPKFLSLEICDAENETRSQHPCPLDIREVDTLKRFQAWRLREGHSPIFRSRPYLEPLGDREVVCLPGHEGVQIWFFNPRFVPDVPNTKPFIPML